MCTTLARSPPAGTHQPSIHLTATVDLSRGICSPDGVRLRCICTCHHGQGVWGTTVVGAVDSNAEKNQSRYYPADAITFCLFLRPRATCIDKQCPSEIKSFGSGNRNNAAFDKPADAAVSAAAGGINLPQVGKAPVSVGVSHSAVAARTRILLMHAGITAQPRLYPLRLNQEREPSSIPALLRAKQSVQSARVRACVDVIHPSHVRNMCRKQRRTRTPTAVQSTPVLLSVHLRQVG